MYYSMVAILRLSAGGPWSSLSVGVGACWDGAHTNISSYVRFKNSKIVLLSQIQSVCYGSYTC
jgi:hypothetical protein